jgi:hypothetical protein
VGRVAPTAEEGQVGEGLEDRAAADVFGEVHIAFNPVVEPDAIDVPAPVFDLRDFVRSEEHTSELQSLS